MQRSVISDQSQFAGYRLQVTGYVLQVAVPVAVFRLCVTVCRLRVTGFRLYVTGFSRSRNFSACSLQLVARSFSSRLCVFAVKKVCSRSFPARSSQLVACGSRLVAFLRVFASSREKKYSVAVSSFVDRSRNPCFYLLLTTHY